jgi:hypothetical protein
LGFGGGGEVIILKAGATPEYAMMLPKRIVVGCWAIRPGRSNRLTLLTLLSASIFYILWAIVP